MMKLKMKLILAISATMSFAIVHSLIAGTIGSAFSMQASVDDFGIVPIGNTRGAPYTKPGSIKSDFVNPGTIKRLKDGAYSYKYYVTPYALKINSKQQEANWVDQIVCVDRTSDVTIDANQICKLTPNAYLSTKQQIHFYEKLGCIKANGKVETLSRSVTVDADFRFSPDDGINLGQLEFKVPSKPGFWEMKYLINFKMKGTPEVVSSLPCATPFPSSTLAPAK